MTDAVIGIFVGGAGKRMGFVPKGLLRAPDNEHTLIERLLALCGRVAPKARVYLVGSGSAYDGMGVPRLSDDPAGIGPIGGLRSLLVRARDERCAAALALACDLPFIDEGVLRELLEPLALSARVPLAQGRRQPLAALYASEAALVATERALALGQRALMQVLDQLSGQIQTLNYDEVRAEALRDWDTPDDMRRHRS